MQKACPICLDNIGETNSCVTSCNHSFCLSCLSISLQNNVSCPLCRSEIVPESKKITELKEEIDEIEEVLNNRYSDISFLKNELEEHKEEIKKIIHRYADVEGPIDRKYVDDNGPCIICGCASELDEYGDRVCYCDTCYKDGCCEEWPVVGKFPKKNRYIYRG